MTNEEEAIEILMTFGKDGCTIADSGGKDSSVLKHIAMKCREKYGLDFKVVHNHTTVDAPETVYFVREERKKMLADGIQYDISYPKKTMWKLIEEKLMPPTRLVRYCCGELKESYGKGEKIVTGVRRSESINRAKNQGVITFPDKKKEVKELVLNGTNFIQTNKGGVVLYNYDNADDVRMVNQCMRTNKVLVNPLINWTDDDLWKYISDEKIKLNPLYECGWNRVGCIGCPMASKQRWSEFSIYPKYKDLYISAFDRMLDKRHEKGIPTEWENGLKVFKWWMEDDNCDGQFSVDLDGNITEDYV